MPTTRHNPNATTGQSADLRFGLSVRAETSRWGEAWMQASLPGIAPKIGALGGVTLLTEAEALAKPAVAKSWRRHLESASVADARRRERIEGQVTSRRFLVVPPNLAVPVVIHVDWMGGDRKNVGSSGLVIMAGRGSSVEVVERVGGNGGGRHSVHVVADAGSRVRHTRLQDLGESSADVTWREATISADAELEWNDCLFGAQPFSASVTRLAGDGARVVLRRLAFGDRGRQVVTDDIVRHLAKSTISDLRSYGIAADRSRVIQRACADVTPHQNGATVNQELRTLITSATAWAANLPELEVACDDVKCRHAAATGRLDAERLYYLMSRGLDETAARRLLVMSHLAPLVRELRASGLAEMIECLIAARLGATVEDSNLFSYERQ